MNRNIFDFEDGDIIFQTSGPTTMDMDGHLMTRMTSDMELDLDTGEFHMTSSWNNKDNDECDKCDE